MNKLTILLSAYALAPNMGTEPGSGWGWMLALSNRGHVLHVLTREENRSAIEKAVIPKNIFIHYINLPYLRHGSGAHYGVWQILAYIYSTKLRKHQRIDVVHHVTYGSLMGGSHLWRLKLPMVFGPIGGGQTTPMSMISYFAKGKIKEIIRTILVAVIPYSPFHRVMFKGFSVILTTNEDTSALVKKTGVESHPFLDTGLSQNYFSSTVKIYREDSILNIVWVGNFRTLKGFKLTLQSLRLLTMPWQLTVVAGGYPDHECLEIIKENNMQDRIIFKGRVPWEEVRDEYIKSDLMLFTSLRESFGAQLLEAQAVGLPIVVLNLHGAKSNLSDDAVIKVDVRGPADTPREIAVAIQRFHCLSIESKEAMSQAAIEWARGHSWTNRVEKIEKIYQFCIDVNPGEL